MKIITPESYAEVRNARVSGIKVGSAYHDGFFTILLDGAGWDQGVQNVRWDPDTVDKINAVCGAEDLFSCIGKLVRVCWASRLRGSGPNIAALAHIFDDTKMLVIMEPGG